MHFFSVAKDFSDLLYRGLVPCDYLYVARQRAEGISRPFCLPTMSDLLTARFVRCSILLTNPVNLDRGATPPGFNSFLRAGTGRLWSTLTAHQKSFPIFADAKGRVDADD